MYVDSLNVDNRKQRNRLLRSNEKYISKTDRKIGTKYQRSPYYIGTLLWNELPVNTVKHVYFGFLGTSSIGSN